MQGPDRIRLRIAVLGMVSLSLFSVLVVRLWFLQVLAFETYDQAAANNQIRVIPIEPARGRILDRNGEILVRNRASLVVGARLDEFVDRKETVERLAPILQMTTEEIEKRLQDKRALPYTAVPIKEDVPEDVYVYIRENQDRFRGIVAEVRPVRVYPHGSAASHVLGYTGEITAEQLDDEKYKEYRPGSIVGRSGIEYAYEQDLRGNDGKQKILVNASGKAYGEPLGGEDPRRGYDVVTSLDLNFQRLAEESLALGVAKARSIFDKESQKRYIAPAGGVLIMDPQNGEILAIASYPTYDPSSFVGGISRAEFGQLAGDPANPLLNRVIQAPFPPGSTFKVVTAAAALQDGLATRNGRYACPASFRFADTTFRNWKSVDSGSISLVQSLIDSCDTVFYQFGAEFWRRFDRNEGERLQDYARSFGYGARTGVDLGEPFEKAGRVPDENWLKTMHAQFPKAFPYRIWLPGYTINMSIGQGDLISTPLQLANSYAAIANGGTLIRPHVGMRVMDDDRVVRTIGSEEIRKLNISAANLDIIRRGLEGVPTQGTAQGAFAGFPFDKVSVAAKTGTAELQTVPPKQPYAWFVAYAPAKNPKFLVTVMLEEGGHGGETAAPIARRILEGLFGLSVSEIQPAARTD